MQTRTAPPSTGRSCDVLLLIALHEEWLCFRRVFSEAREDEIVRLAGLDCTICRFDVAGYDIVAATINPNNFAAKHQGKVPAAVYSAALLAAYTPQLLVNIGLACRIDSARRLGSVIVASTLVDVTGNCAVVSDGGSPSLTFQPGKEHIECTPDLRGRIVELKTTHGDAYSKWAQDCASRRSLDPVIGPDELLKEGALASGDFLLRSAVYHSVVTGFLRTVIAYDMESFAVFETARLVGPRPSPAFLALKGLSDDGNHEKAAQERAGLRDIAVTNALTLFRLALEVGILLEARQGAPNSEHGAASSTVVTPRRDFPYFASRDLKLTRRLLKGIASDHRGKRVARIVKTANEAIHYAFSAQPDQQSLADWLNVVIDSDFHEDVAWEVDDTFRLRKICRDFRSGSPQFREHSKQVVNRLLLEHELLYLDKQSVVRQTPIVTCLVENTGQHRALEAYKTAFQRKHQVVIDFDAVPLDQLYSISNAEFSGSTDLSKYDIVFHYHLAASRLYGLKVVARMSDKTLQKWRRSLIPEVEAECCTVVDGKGRAKRAIAPVNANTMVLLTNDAIFRKHETEYMGWSGGLPLRAPDTWADFRRILEFMSRKANAGVYGIVPQGKMSGDSLYFEWCNVAFGMGGGVFRKDHGWQKYRRDQVILDSRATIEATDFYRHEIYARCPPDRDPSLLDARGQIDRFAGGDVAMAIVWSDMLFEFFQQEQSGYSAHVIPGERSMVGGGVCCVHAGAKEQDVCMAFVSGLFEPTTQVALAASGWCSGYRAVYRDPNVAALPYSAAVEESLSRSGYMIEAGPDGARVRELVGSSLDAIVRGNGDTASTLAKAATLLRSGFSV